MVVRQLGSADRDARMGLFVCGSDRPAGCRMRGRDRLRRRIEALSCCRYDGFCCKTELFEQQASGRARSVVIDADDPPGVTDEVTPTDPDPGLDRDACLDLWRDDCVPL